MGALDRSRRPASGSSEMYELFPRLGERRRQAAGTMTGGERQMLAMARALMPDPQVLLLDEPSAGLAPAFVEAIFEKIAEINRHGVTIVMVEQNARRALGDVRRAATCSTSARTGSRARARSCSTTRRSPSSTSAARPRSDGAPDEPQN